MFASVMVRTRTRSTSDGQNYVLLSVSDGQNSTVCIFDGQNSYRLGQNSYFLYL
jgi:hypothetical protein